MAHDLASAHMKKSFSRLKSAYLLNTGKQYDEVVGAAYYAVFHAASALLAIKGLHFNSHNSHLAPNITKIE